MFDEEQVDVALAYCDRCEVLDECLRDAVEYAGGLTEGVVAGINRFQSRGRRAGARLVRTCRACERPMYLRPGDSGSIYCSISCVVREASGADFWNRVNSVLDMPTESR